MVSCPLLPLDTLGGLVGVVTVKVQVSVEASNYEKEVAVIFGYPPSLKRQVAKIVRHFDYESPLKHDLQKYAPFGDSHNERHVMAIKTYLRGSRFGPPTRLKSRIETLLI
jgi:hypothetical protein